MSTYADACPGCYPGDHPAVFPWLTRHLEGARVITHYWCPVPGCGRKWRCRWDVASAEWPVARRAA